MNNNGNNNTFVYNYSAREQEEIRQIRSKYEAKSETVSKMDLLRKLDRKVTQTSTVVSLTVGIIGTLMMGFGMSLVMVWAELLFGCIVGIVGILIAALSYPIYLKITEDKRKELAPEILNLADELLEK